VIKDKYQMTGNPGPISDQYTPTTLDIAEALARIESLLGMLCEFVEDTPEGPILCVRPVQRHEPNTGPGSSLGDDLIAMMRKRKAEVES